MGDNSQLRYLTHNGQSLTTREWAKKLGISYGTIHVRLTRGWSIARALTPCPEILKGIRRKQFAATNELTLEGITKPYWEWCEEYKITWALVRCRMYQGWDPKEAVTWPANGKHRPRRPKTGRKKIFFDELKKEAPKVIRNNDILPMGVL